MSHDRFGDRLLELAYGELSPREAREVEAHAESCAECGAELGRIRATRRVMGALPDERAPDAGERILLAAAREAARDRAPARRILPAWVWSASVLAALVVAVGAVSYRILAMRPAAERPGEELLGRAQYAEPPSTSAPAPAPAEDEAQAAPSPSAAPPPARAAPPPRAAKPTAPSPGKRRAPAGAREEQVRTEAGKAEPAQASPPAEGRAVANEPPSARKAPESRAAEEDVGPAAPEELAGFAEPPSRMEEAPPRSDVATARSRSAGAPAAASAPAPRALPAPASPAAPDRSAAALARYSALRAAGSLSGEIRTFTDCEGESWRKVERDQEGRTVKYVREGRVAGRRVRVEHLFGADGGLAAVRVTDLDRGGVVVPPGALGLSVPRDASEAGPDAEPRCER
ncbi:MAG TPA: zf-HC2 domain-containing protein [Anaeromyxobacter sp.]|nr:zf-HC2 domain-containing protein [Anaeromyxobacter sp.]